MTGNRDTGSAMTVHLGPWRTRPPQHASRRAHHPPLGAGIKAKPCGSTFGRVLTPTPHRRSSAPSRESGQTGHKLPDQEGLTGPAPFRDDLRRHRARNQFRRLGGDRCGEPVGHHLRVTDRAEEVAEPPQFGRSGSVRSRSNSGRNVRSVLRSRRTATRMSCTASGSPSAAPVSLEPIAASCVARYLERTSRRCPGAVTGRYATARVPVRGSPGQLRTGTSRPRPSRAKRRVHGVEYPARAGDELDLHLAPMLRHRPVTGCAGDLQYPPANPPGDTALAGLQRHPCLRPATTPRRTFDVPSGIIAAGPSTQGDPVGRQPQVRRVEVGGVRLPLHRPIDHLHPGYRRQIGHDEIEWHPRTCVSTSVFVTTLSAYPCTRHG